MFKIDFLLETHTLLCRLTSALYQYRTIGLILNKSINLNASSTVANGTVSFFLLSINVSPSEGTKGYNDGYNKEDNTQKSHAAGKTHLYFSYSHLGGTVIDDTVAVRRMAWVS